MCPRFTKENWHVCSNMKKLRQCHDYKLEKVCKKGNAREHRNLEFLCVMVSWNMGMVCVSGWEGEHVLVCACLCAHSKWFKSFTEVEHFDINVAGRPFVQEQGPSAAFMLVNCQERSVKGGPLAREGVAGVSPGGSPHRRGKLVTDLLGFQDPLCGPLQGKAAPFTRGVEQGRVGLNGRRRRIGPCSRERRQDASFTRSSPLDQMFHVSEILAENKLSYCTSTAVQGKFYQLQINPRHCALTGSSMC